MRIKTLLCTFLLSLSSLLSIPSLAQTSIKIDINGHLYSAVLTTNNSLLQTTGQSPTSQHYAGHLVNQEDSWLRLSNINGDWQGIVSLAGTTYTLNSTSSEAGLPITVENDTLSKHPHAATVHSPVTNSLVLNATDLASLPPQQCGTPHSNTSSANAVISTPANTIINQPIAKEVAFSTLCSSGTIINGTCLLAELEIAFDQAFQEDFGSAAQAQAEALINITEGFFRNDFNITFDTLTLTMLDEEIFSPSIILSNQELEAGDAVDDLFEQRFENELGFLTSRQSIFHLVTGRNFTGGTAGIAFEDTLCSFGAIGITQVLNNFAGQPNISLTALIATHEIGHNLGAGHDGEDNSCASDFIMAPTLSGSANQFSSCSISEISTEISNVSTPSQCFNFPADLNITSDANNSTEALTDVEVLLDFQVDLETGFQAAASLNVTGSISSDQSRFTQASIAGQACTITGGGTGYQCTLNNPQASSTLQIGFQSDVAATISISHQASLQNSPDVVDINSTNNQLQAVVNITQNPNPPEPEPPASSGGGGGGGGSLTWELLLILSLLLMHCRYSSRKAVV